MIAEKAADLIRGLPPLAPDIVTAAPTDAHSVHVAPG
jgi:hypothetical protein